MLARDIYKAPYKKFCMPIKTLHIFILPISTCSKNRLFGTILDPNMVLRNLGPFREIVLWEGSINVCKNFESRLWIWILIVFFGSLVQEGFFFSVILDLKIVAKNLGPSNENMKFWEIYVFGKTTSVSCEYLLCIPGPCNFGPYDGHKIFGANSEKWRWSDIRKITRRTPLPSRLLPWIFF